MTEAERAGPFERTPMAWPQRIVAEVRSAVSFLTRLPVGPVAAAPGRTGAAAFGMVGASVGGIGAIALLVLGGRAPLAAGAIAVGAMAVASGVLHLDGLADTADALSSPNPVASNRARKDPAVGPAGVAAIAIVALVDVGLLATLAAPVAGSPVLAGPVVAALACVVAAAGSRALPVLAVVLVGGSARAGLGGWFASQVGRGSVVLAGGSSLLIALAASLVVNRPAFVLGTVGGIAIGILVAAWLANVREGLDGDALGAIVEVGFAAILLVVVLTL